jgi:phosphotriesterase-related protein
VGEQQARVFESEGLNPAKVCIGHSNDTTDLDYLTGILKRGYWLGMDRFPSHRPDVPDWKQRCDTIKALIDSGWGHRIMVSHDDPITLLIQPRAQREERFRQNPDHICFIKRRALPYLRESGVAEENVRALVYDNPRKFFEG